MPKKTVPKFDKDTGYFKNFVELESNPKGQFHIPNDCLDADATPQSNKVAKNNNGTIVWEDDYRGQTVYDTTTGESEIIQDVGAIPAGKTLIVKPAKSKWETNNWVDDLDEYKDEYYLEIESIKNSELTGGFTYSSVTYATDTQARQLLNNAMNMCLINEVNSNPYTATVLKADGTLVTIEKSVFLTLYANFSQWEIDLHTKSKTIKTHISTLDLTGLQAFVSQTYWDAN